MPGRYLVALRTFPHRAFCAAEILALAAADSFRRLRRGVEATSSAVASCAGLATRRRAVRVVLSA
jgi:hypothetical protein